MLLATVDAKSKFELSKTSLVGNACSEPLIMNIGIRLSRSYKLIEEVERLFMDFSWKCNDLA